MRLPDSGSLIGSIVNGLGHTTADGTGVAVDGVTEAQLVDALDAMTRGEIEYVILEEGDEFLQAAGDGAGPYALQFSPASGDGLEEVRGGVDGQRCGPRCWPIAARDRAWRGSLRWSAL